MKKHINKDMKIKEKAKTYTYWYRLFSPVLCYLCWMLSIFLYGIGKEYGFGGKVAGLSSGILLFNLIVWWMKKKYNNKFPEYKYLLKDVDMCKFFNILLIVFVIIILCKGR